MVFWGFANINSIIITINFDFTHVLKLTILISVDIFIEMVKKNGKSHCIKLFVPKKQT